MRDVPEDWPLGRVYLPQDELERFGVTRGRHRRGPDRARDGAGSWRTRRSRAPRAPDRGARPLALLDSRSALCVRALAGIYARPASTRSSAGATTSSRSDRASPRSASCGSVGSSRVRAVVVGGGPRRADGRARSGRRGRDGDPARGAADARRRRSDTARARGRSGPAARQRPARRARLLHRVPRRSSARSARTRAIAASGSPCR